MRKSKGFTLIELLVVISIIALLIGILLPALGAARRTARQMQSNTQVRGIQQAFVLYAQGNNTYYPGMDTLGAIDTVSDDGGDGYDPDWRFQIMLTNNFFTGEYVISPVDVKTVWTTGNVDSGMYSYAVLDLDQVPERVEWRDTINTEAIVVSDRNTGTGTTEKTLNSLWTGKKGDWRGSIGWNDNHTTFETEAVDYTTKYGNFTMDENDNLFKDDRPLDGDAQMVYDTKNKSSS
jgi:prepilin-type N-terminal cleavage/methylation domain-containing protein